MAKSRVGQPAEETTAGPLDPASQALGDSLKGEVRAGGGRRGGGRSWPGGICLLVDKHPGNTSWVPGCGTIAVGTEVNGLDERELEGVKGLRGRSPDQHPPVLKKTQHPASPPPSMERAAEAPLWGQNTFLAQAGFESSSSASKLDALVHIVKANAEAGSARMSLLILVSIFLSAASVMFLVYKNFPQLSEEERANMKIPRDMDDAKALGKVLSKYKDTFYVQVLVAYFATYIFLQTFAIPGSIFLSILSGFLYPFPLALFLVCLCSGLGASFCYMLSYLVGRPVVYKYLTEKAVKWSQQVERHRDHLINYIIFLRITPFLPNWFINITSPVINVPLKVFFIGTFLGVAPPSFVAIKAGTTLYQLTTAGEAVSWNSVFVLMILAVLSILPAVFQKKLKQKFQ
ncbi:transmembrane protein 41B [Gracilinanus agilis]|uniref:transmembrane protein 41B n=1 Tax=Gracilinanus agilis TaxID=191870 RepID=UPI001CFE3C01|nr:transmembrane protein 41B [Gracilinanus agilis]